MMPSATGFKLTKPCLYSSKEVLDDGMFEDSND